jgi:hypothetical protein
LPGSGWGGSAPDENDSAFLNATCLKVSRTQRISFMSPLGTCTVTGLAPRRSWSSHRIHVSRVILRPIAHQLASHSARSGPKARTSGPDAARRSARFHGNAKGVPSSLRNAAMSSFPEHLKSTDAPEYYGP